ncbi:MAG: hypothetical protein U0324_03290 [Polyangiales bacterium]
MAPPTPESPAARWPAAAAAAVAALTWAPSLAGGFVWDDRFLVADNEALRRPDFLRAIFTQQLWSQGAFDDRELYRYYRPLVSLAWWAVLRASSSPAAFHALNVALHALCAGLAVRLVQRLAAPPPAAAFAAGALFAVHGSRLGTVAWITGLLDLVPALVALLALAPATEAPDAREGRRPWILAAFTAAALAAKETSAVLPGLFLAVTPHAVGPRRAALRVAPAAAAVLAYGAARAALLPLGGERWPLALHLRLGVALDTLGRYARLTAWPTSTLVADVLRSDAAGAPSLSAANVALGTAALVACAALAAVGWRRRDLALRAAPLLWLLPIAPSLNFVWPGPIHPQAALARYLYLSLLGPALLLARALAAPLARSPARARPLALAVVAAAAAWLPARLDEQSRFRDEGAFFRHEHAARPDEPLMAQAVCSVLRQEGRVRASYGMALRALAAWRAVEPRRRLEPALVTVAALEMALATVVPPDDLAQRRALADALQPLWTRGRAGFAVDGHRFELDLRELGERGARTALRVHASILSDLGDDRAALALLGRGLATCARGCEELLVPAVQAHVRLGEPGRARALILTASGRRAPRDVAASWLAAVGSLEADLASGDGARAARALLAVSAPARALAALPPEGASVEADALRVEALLALRRDDEAARVIEARVAPRAPERAEALRGLAERRRRAAEPLRPGHLAADP